MIINNYDVFIFDLDGTIIDSEFYHYQAYNNQLDQKLEFEEYCKIFHSKKKKKFL